MRKVAKLPHRNRNKTARHRARLKKKLERKHQRRSKGERKTYR